MRSKLSTSLSRLLSSSVLAIALTACGLPEAGIASDSPDGDPIDAPPGGTPRPGGPPPTSPVANPGTAKRPLILAHGLGGSAESFSADIVAALTAEGHVVFRTQVPDFASIAERAASLGTQVDAILTQTGADKVHLVGHSMGGLDSRYLVSRMGYAGKVASVTTLSTPHRGSRAADAALGLTGEGRSQAAIILLAGATGADDPDVEAAIYDLTETQAAIFNQATPDVAGVVYQSWAGLSKVGGFANSRDIPACTAQGGIYLAADQSKRDIMSFLFTPVAPVVAHGSALLPNDGVVTVESGRWGTFKGCIPADHTDITSEIMDTHTGFDLLQFYRNMGNEIAALP